MAAFGDPRTIPKDQIAPALQKVMIAYAYLTSAQEAERRLNAAYDKALAQIGPG